jgi:uncharacterized protein YcbX
VTDDDSNALAISPRSLRQQDGPRLVGRVSQIFRFPVKSMVGEGLPETVLGTAGIPGDRIWAVRDLEVGEITSAKRLPGLLRCAAQYANQQSTAMEIVLPSGRRISPEQADASAALSEELGRRLSLEALAPAKNRRHYRLRKMRSPADLRRLLGVAKRGPMPDMAQLPLSMLATLALHATPPGTYFDSFPLHLLTTSSLAACASRLGRAVEAERFRANLIIDTSAENSEFPELEWIGGRMRIGAAELAIRCGTFRCGMPAHPQAGGIAKAPDVVRVVYDQLDSKLGVYASVIREGAVVVGDPVTIEVPSARSVTAALARFGRRVKRKILDVYLGIG